MLDGSRLSADLWLVNADACDIIERFIRRDPAMEQMYIAHTKKEVRS
jgi:hypothetical protein